MNFVATSLPASPEPCEGGWDVCIFAAALSERRTAPWLQGVRTYDGQIDLAAE